MPEGPFGLPRLTAIGPLVKEKVDAGDVEFEEELKEVISEFKEKTLLSERESQVVVLDAAGFNNEEIAGLLGIGTSTVETYKKRVREKLTEAMRNVQKLEDVFD
jgi:DNA-binding NarL/FixJ family response regulator